MPSWIVFLFGGVIAANVILGSAFHSIAPSKQQRRQHYQPKQFIVPLSSSSRVKTYNDNNIQRRIVSSSTSLFAATSCSVELIDPETGCEVVLLGCFHGSQSSAIDVERTLSSKRTDVIVLELCADRFDDLQREVVEEMKQRRRSSSQPKSDDESLNKNSNEKSPWLFRYAQMVYQTSQTKGLSSGAAVAVLGGVSGMQTALSGLQPGLEFTTALRIATSDSATSSNTMPSNNNYNDKIDIVLADQNVDVTIYKMGQLPQISLGLWRDLITKGWNESFGREASALQTALLGNNIHDNCVQLPAFLTRSDAAIRDLIRLTIPPLFIVQALSLSISHVVATAMSLLISATSAMTGLGDANAINSVVASTTAAGGVFESDPSWLVLGGANALFLGLAYLSVALPTARVILRERDDQLTDGIRAACRIASASAGDGRGRVVAVLGLLHVNGIAQRMLSSTTAVALDETTTTVVPSNVVT